MAFFRNAIGKNMNTSNFIDLNGRFVAYADFHTLAAVTVYIAFRDFKRQYVVCHIVLIWLVALVTASLPLSGMV